MALLLALEGIIELSIPVGQVEDMEDMQTTIGTITEEVKTVRTLGHLLLSPKDSTETSGTI